MAKIRGVYRPLGFSKIIMWVAANDPDRNRFHDAADAIQYYHDIADFGN